MFFFKNYHGTRINDAIFLNSFVISKDKYSIAIIKKCVRSRQMITMYWWLELWKCFSDFSYVDPPPPWYAFHNISTTYTHTHTQHYSKRIRVWWSHCLRRMPPAREKHTFLLLLFFCIFMQHWIVLTSHIFAMKLSTPKFIIYNKNCNIV